MMIYQPNWLQFSSFIWVIWASGNLGCRSMGTLLWHFEANTDIGLWSWILIKKCVAFGDGIRRSVIPSMVGNSRSPLAASKWEADVAVWGVDDSLDGKSPRFSLDSGRKWTAASLTGSATHLQGGQGRWRYSFCPDILPAVSAKCAWEVNLFLHSWQIFTLPQVSIHCFFDNALPMGTFPGALNIFIKMPGKRIYLTFTGQRLKIIS